VGYAGEKKWVTEDRSGEEMLGGEISIVLDRPVGNMGPVRGNSLNRRQRALMQA
jgi:hypothetical protein